MYSYNNDTFDLFRTIKFFSLYDYDCVDWFSCMSSKWLIYRPPIRALVPRLVGGKTRVGGKRHQIPSTFRLIQRLYKMLLLLRHHMLTVSLILSPSTSSSEPKAIANKICRGRGQDKTSLLITV